MANPSKVVKGVETAGRKRVANLALLMQLPSRMRACFMKINHLVADSAQSVRSIARNGATTHQLGVPHAPT
ncbi:MAG: hypothetical protein KA795_01460 [Burkholderiaceae bacterium]|nr:hypothetical protein [Burkholderiaceae bacterium]